MKIVFFEATPNDQEALTSMVIGQELIFVKDKLSVQTIAGYTDADIISVFVGSQVSREIIDALPHLKLIATRSTGFDHIDYAYAQSKGIAVATVPAYGSRTVAEFAFGLILTLSRKIFDACRQTREEGAFDPMHLQGFDLNSKTIGVIGTGKIGKNIVRIAKGFAMNIVAFDAFPDQTFATEAGFQYVDLNTLLTQSDIVTLHTPYMKETHHLINKDNIKLMKQGSYLINTARGELVETDALVQALSSGHLAGAGLDVLEGEHQLKEEAELFTSNTQDYKMLFEDLALMKMPNVIITPHLAFNSKEAVTEIMQITADNILGFIAGKPVNILKA